MIVVDAGAVVELLLRSAVGATVLRLVETEEACSPELLDAEVLNTLARLERHGHMDAAGVEARLELLESAPIVRFPHGNLLRPAHRYTVSLSGYDALYVALAAFLGCPLVTTDAGIAATGPTQFGVAVTHLPPGGRG